MLRWVGFENAGILDGGLEAWKNQGYLISTDEVTRPKQTLTLSIQSDLIANRDEVFAAIENKNIDIFDAMPGPHYQGLFAMYARPGHIASAKSMPTSELEESGKVYRLKENWE